MIVAGERRRFNFKLISHHMVLGKLKGEVNEWFGTGVLT